MIFNAFHIFINSIKLIIARVTTNICIYVLCTYMYIRSSEIGSRKILRTSKSPNASDSTYVLGTFLILECRRIVRASTPFPVRPINKIRMKMIGTKYVSGRSLYGMYSSSSSLVSFVIISPITS